MFTAQSQKTLNPFIVMCFVLAYQVVTSACLLIDYTRL
jgi:hypothetical protein